MNNRLLWTLMMTAALSACAAPGQAIKARLNRAEFRDRVYACWLGKNIGGTLGMPFEGKKLINNISFYTNLKPGEPAANDDLDLQMLWLKAMQEHGGRVDARILGEYWLKYVPVDWNEYGVGKRNMRRGFLPPLSGHFDNAKWRPSNGAWIRSEIWACIAPGMPALAAQMAREDAAVDHGAAEGTLAEIFTASLESAAFIEHDRDRLIDIGLAMIPPDCGVVRAIRAARDAYRAGKDWEAARSAVIRTTQDTGWFQAPRNVAFVMIGWLYGEGDFGKSLCTAVNCADDTDCTGATLGSILGILRGTEGIPAKWSEPIGTKIETVAISGFENPKDIGALTDQTLAMTEKVLAMHDAPVALTDGATDLSGAAGLKLADREAARELWRISPYRIVWNEADAQVVLDYLSDPVIRPGQPHAFEVTVRNLTGAERRFQLAVTDVPSDWKVELADAAFTLGPNAEMRIRAVATAAASGPKDYRMKVEVTGASRKIEIPLTLVIPKFKVPKQVLVIGIPAIVIVLGAACALVYRRRRARRLTPAGA